MLPKLITKEDLDAIRSLSDSNLTALIAETNDGGWMLARRTLGRMKRTAARREAEQTAEIQQSALPSDVRHIR